MLKLDTITLAILAAMALATTSTVQAQNIDYSKYGDYAKYGNTEDMPGLCSYKSIAQKNYKGKTLRVIANAVPVLGEPAILHAKQFADLTGAKVDVVNVPFGDLYQRILIPFQTGQSAYDVLIYGSLWLGDFHNFLAPVPEKYLQSKDMQEITPTYQDVAKWGNQTLQYTIDGDRNYLKVRSDVFNNPEMQQKYKKETGETLEIPKTWEEYNKIAKFFSGWDWAGDGKTHYGSSEITKRDDLMFSAIIDRVAAYAKNPHVKDGFFFKLNGMVPQVNNPGWVKGVQMFVDAQKAFPPGGSNFGLGDSIFSFGGGQTLMEYSWDDPFIQAQEKGSPIRNKVLAAPLPGSYEVWNSDTNKWDKFDKPNAPQYITWGWTAAVAKSSKNQEMAFDYLCFFSNDANHNLDLQIGRFGINPYRSGDFKIGLWRDKLGWSQPVAESYVKTLSAIDGSNDRVFDLRVPGVNQFMSSLANGVAEAMAGQKSVQAAMDGVAQRWNQILDSVGRDNVKTAYENIVKLENARH